MTALVVGADVGGTSTRAMAATLDGVVRHAAAGPGANPITVGLEESARRIRDVVGRCLPPYAEVRAMVVGLAGGSGVGPAFTAAVVPEPIPVPARIVSDISVAFASATPAPEGYVLIAGTGAVAAHVAGDELLERRDGWGWLLGDEGSGFWLGREAVRSTLLALQRDAPLGTLHRAVLAATSTSDAPGLLRRCYAEAPIWLATLGSLVAAHADDPAAAVILEGAVECLDGLLVSLQPRADPPIVLAGSVADPTGPVGARLRQRLASRWRNPVLGASNGLVGALWVASRSCGVTAAAVHAQLITSTAAASSGLRPSR